MTDDDAVDESFIADVFGTAPTTATPCRVGEALLAVDDPIRRTVLHLLATDIVNGRRVSRAHVIRKLGERAGVDLSLATYGARHKGTPDGWICAWCRRTFGGS